MKPFLQFLSALLLVSATPVHAFEDALVAAQETSAAKLAPGFALREEPHTVVARDDGVRIWQQIKYLTNSNFPDPQVQVITNRYTEIGAGICFQQPDGTWADSQARFVLTKDGSVEATEIPHKVRISPDLRSIAAVQMTLPDGGLMSSTFRGLYLYDSSTQKRLLVSDITNSIGTLISSNVVVFTNCFASLDGDLVLKVTPAGLAQDVIIRESLAWISFDEIAFDPKSTVLEAWTEFYDAPAPDKQTNTLPARASAEGQIDPLSDENLKFGNVLMVPGRAYLTAPTNGAILLNTAAATRDSAPVGKAWQEQDGRRFLIERLRWREILPQFKRLETNAALDATTAGAASAKVGRGVPAEPPVGGASVLASRLQPVTSDLPPRLLASTTTTTNRSIQLAPSPLWGEGRASQSRLVGSEVLLAQAGSRPALIFDYTTVSCPGSTCNGYRFAPNETYYISSPVTINNDAVFCGGTVIKIAPWLPGPSITINGTAHFETGPGRMVIITGRDDDSVGQVLTPISTGNPSVAYGYPALYFTYNSAPATIDYLRISRAPQSIYFENASGTTHKIRHSQFVNGWSGIVCIENNLTVHNVLFSSIDTPFEGYYFNIHGEQVTVHRAFMLASDWFEEGIPRLTLINSIIVEAGACSPSTCSTPAPTVWLAPEDYPFQTSLLGAYYLPQNSAYHRVGSPSIDPQLRCDLKQKATYVPTPLPATISANLVLHPTARRNDGLNPDIGFSYDAVDYIAQGVLVQSGTLLATNGVVIGLDAGALSAGIRIAPGAQVISEGTPVNMNRFVELRSVQEQHGSAVNVFYIFQQQASTTTAPQLRLRFTDLPWRAGLWYQINREGGVGVISLQDCQMSGGGMYANAGGNYEYTFALTNNLFEGSQFTVSGGTGTHLHLWNNTFIGGSMTLYSPNFTWNAYDNLFHEVTLSCNGSFVNDYNAYYQTTPLSTGGGNLPLYSAVNFAIGALGKWYLPAGSTPLLRAGSQTPGAAGLYHHTTQITQQKEGCKLPDINGQTRIDLGFHYVAVCPRNLAVGKKATQSTTDSGGIADRAVDGNIDGSWSAGSVSRTASGANPWWELDLGTSEQVDTLKIWDRTDPPGDTLNNFFVIILDAPFQSTDLNATLNQAGVSWQQVGTVTERSTTLQFYRTARHIRIQRSIANSYLALAEVQVLGPYSPIDTDDDGIPDYMEDRDGSGTTTPPETRFDVADLDHDNDGMPTKWELKYSLLPLDPVDKLLDADGDGFVNYREYELTQDPRVPDPPRVYLDVSDAVASEAGQDPAVFSLSREGSLSDTLNVTISKSGTAQYITDYAFFGNSVQIPAGQSSVPINIIPVNDADRESSESVTLTIGAPPQGSPPYTIGNPASGTVTILDNDDVKPTVTISAAGADSTAREVGPTAGRFTVTRINDDLTRGLIVFLIRSGSATLSDYLLDPPSAIVSVEIPVGETSKIITLTPVADDIVEGSETLKLTIRANSTYTIGSPSEATVTIIDKPSFTITAIDPTCIESGTVNGRFRIARAGDPVPSLTLNLFPPTGSAIETTDYGALPRTLQFIANQLEAFVEVDPVIDAISEPDEDVKLTLKAGTGYTIGQPDNATVIIQDKPTVTITSAAPTDTANEVGPVSGKFTVRRTGNTSGSLQVNLSLPGGMATEGVDYSALTRSFTFTPNEISRDIVVTPIPDSLDEADETVTLSILASSAYVSSSASATVIIIDAPTLPTVTISVSDADKVASEIGPVTGRFTITRDGNLSSGLNVSLAAPTGSALEGTDYTALPRTITIPASQASATVLVTPVQDGNNNEPDETVVLSIASGSYNIQSPNTATVIIVDDRPAVTVSATADAAESEFDDVTVGKFVIDRGTVDITVPLRVNYSVGGTAQAAVDYQTLPGFIMVPAGVQTAEVNVVPLYDTEFEGRETVTLTIATGNYDIGSPNTAQVSIIDDELPMLSVSAESADNDAREAGAVPGAFTIIRPNIGTLDLLTIHYSLHGEAKNGEDYEQLSGSIDIPAGATSVRLVLQPIDDSLPEGPESVILELTPDLTYDVGPASYAVVTIRDNDLPKVAVVAPDNRAAEPKTGVAADPGRFTIVREGDLRDPLDVYFNFSNTAGFAINGIDFTGLTSPARIPAGANKIDLTVAPLADATEPRYEGTEQAQLVLQANATYQIDPSRGSATVYISDADLPEVTVQVINDNGNDPAFNYLTESGGGSAKFQFTRPSATGQTKPITVLYRVSGSASSEDFQLPAGSITIPAGATTAVLPIQPLEDTIAEMRETVVVTLTGGIDYKIGNPNSATIEIDDNEPPAINSVVIKPTLYWNSEPHVDWNGEFRIRRLGSAISALSGTWSMVPNGSFTASGSGFQVNAATSGTFTIPANKSEISVKYRHSSPSLTLMRLTVASPGVPLFEHWNCIGDHTFLDTVLPCLAADARVSMTAIGGNLVHAGPEDALFTVTGPSGSTVKLKMTGTAVAGSDFTVDSTTGATVTMAGLGVVVTLPAGQTTAGLRVHHLPQTPDPVKYVSFRFDTKDTLNMEYLATPCSTPVWPYLAGSLSETYLRVTVGSYPGGPGQPAGPPIDTDQDGLSDDFEITYMPHGLDPLVPNDPEADPDQDGLNQWAEMLSGTNPFNPDNNFEPANREDYVLVKLRVRDTGKVAVGSCAICHRTRLDVGNISLFSPEQTRTAERIAWFRKGESYPIQLRDLLFDNPRPIQTGTLHTTQKYTAQVLPADAGPPQFVVVENNLNDPLLGVDIPWSTTLGTKQATLIVPRIDLTWEAVIGNVPLEENPAAQGGGLRIFPDDLSPTDTTAGRRNVVLNIATTPPVPGKTVLLKSFDVDDTTPIDFDNARIIDDDFPGVRRTGNDNQGTPKAGDLLNTAITLDTLGRCITVFTVSLKPGDNYRVAVVLNTDGAGQAELNRLQVDDDFAQGWVEADDSPVAGFAGTVSRMLTVWRKLYLEFDSMAAPGSPGSELNHAVGTIDRIQIDYPAGSGQSHLRVTHENLFGKGLDLLEGGKLEIIDVSTYKILKSSTVGVGTAISTLDIEGLPMGVIPGAAVKVFDDDDRYLAHDPPSHPSAVNLPSPPLPLTSDDNQRTTDLVSGIKSRFAFAYIDPVDANAHNMNALDKRLVPFKAHAELDNSGGPYDVGNQYLNRYDRPGFWAHTVVFGYQLNFAEDTDPNGEEYTPGQTVKRRPLLLAPNAYSVIFVEVIRDANFSGQSDQYFTTEPSATAARTSYLRMIQNVLAHEIGHVPGTGTASADHAEDGLMSAIPPENTRIFSDGIPELRFTPPTIRRFRAATRWAD